MTVRFHRTLEQMVEAGAAYSNETAEGRRRTRPDRWFRSLLAGGFVALYLFVMGELVIPFSPALIVAVTGFMIALSYWLYPTRVRRHLRKHYASRQFDASWIGETIVTALPQGLHSRTPVGETLRRWNAVQVLGETAKFVLIQIPDGLIEIPHTAFATEGERRAFQEHLVRCKAGLATAPAVSEPSAVVSTGGSWYHSKESADASQKQGLG